MDAQLRMRGARGLATGREVWVGGPGLAPGASGFASVLVHEAAHVASGGSLAASPPLWDLSDPIDPTWYEIDRTRRAAIEASETGAGRQTTLDRLTSMNDTQARREAPGIAFRAEDRGDVELATRAAARLLAAWLALRDIPDTFSAGWGPDDAVDVLLGRTESAFASGYLELAGLYLSSAMVQLVRAANAAVSRRGAVAAEDPDSSLVRGLLLPIQRSSEQQIAERIQRARQLLDRQGVAITARGSAAEMTRFEEISEAVTSSERRAGPAVASDLGTGGVMDTPEQRQRGHTARSSRTTRPPARPESTPARPIPRAAESIVNSTHPQLEGALVFVRRGSGPTHYGNVRSPRYGVAGTIAGAAALAGQLFGQTSAVIAEDVFANDPATGARQVRYVVAALNRRLIPPDAAMGAGGQVIQIRDLEMLTQPASSRWFFLAISSGPWLFFAPQLQDYLSGIRASERRLPVGPAEPQADEARRQGVFGPIDALIAAGHTQEAADRLVAIGPAGFALVSTETKTRYVVALLRAYTLEPHERTIVEIFRTIAGRDELRAVLQGIHIAGLLHQIHADLQSAFPSLLMVIGERLGSPSLSITQVRGLLSELHIAIPLPGIELRADGSIGLTSLGSELLAALEGLINTITGAVTGIIDIILDPGALLQGIAQLVYFVVMLDMAGRGYPPAVEYVARVLEGLARQLGLATSGLVALRENAPGGVELVRDLQRAIEWRVVWEVLAMFIGVGEAVALIDAIRGGRAAAGIAEVARGLSQLGRSAGLMEGAAATRLLRLATAIEGRAATEAHLLTVMRRIPEPERVRLTRLIGEADDLARLGDEGRRAVRAVRANADALAELQAHLGGDLSRATELWGRLEGAGMDGSTVTRMLGTLPADVALRGRSLRAVERLADSPGANRALLEAVAGSAMRIEAVENIGAANYALLWRRADHDPARADALLSALNARRGTDPAAWQRTLDELRDSQSAVWRDLEAAAGPAPRAAAGLTGARQLEHGATMRRGPDGRRWICINPCAELEHLSIPDDVIESAVRNIPQSLGGVRTADLVDTLAAFRQSADIPAVEDLVRQLSRGGTEASSVVDILERVHGLRQIEGFQFHLPDLVAAHRRGDAVLAHGPLQVPEFVEDMLWRDQRIGRIEITGGRIFFPDRLDLAGVGLPERLRSMDFVIIEGRGGTSRMVLGKGHSGLSGGRPWVFGAGEIGLSRTGEVVSVNRLSGHYRPSPGNPERVLEFLRDHGVIGPRPVNVLDAVPLP